MTDALVEMRNVTKRYGPVTAVEDISLSIRRGEFVVLLGPSGSGKTTLMRSIVGLQRVRAGRVTVLGEPAGSGGLRRRVAYATQAASVYDDLPVRQNLAYFARVLGAPRSDVDRVLEQVGLTPEAKRRIASLSGGQRNRVSLATAMLGSPEVLVLDEPTVGLDPVLRASLWDIFRSLAAAGATLLVSSHVMDEALRCDDLVLLRDGRIIAQTTPAGLLAETGQTDPEAAFLTLIQRSEAAA